MQQRGKFTEGSIMRHVVVMTLATGLGLTFTFLVDFLTLTWISRLNDTEMKAAVGFASNVMFLSVAVTVALMIPAVALVSRKLGSGDFDTAKRYTTSAFVVSFLILLLVTIILMALLEPALTLMGAVPGSEVMHHAKTFLYMVLPTAPFFTFPMIGSAILRANGDAKGSTMMTLSGSLVAMILDPILIYFMQLGIVGGAIVIIIVRLVMLFVFWHLIIRKGKMLAPLREVNLKNFLPPFMAIAIPALLTQISSPLGAFILTKFTSQFGDSYIAASAVNFRVMLLAFGGIFALSGAIGGIIGQNYGAGQLDRVREAYIKAIQFGALYSFVAWCILILARPFLVELFTLDEAGIKYANMFIYFIGHFIFISMLFVSNAAFNNLGRPFWSTLGNWSRDIILTIPFGLLLTSLFGVYGVIYTQALVGIITGAISAVIGWRFLGQIARGEAHVERAKK